MENLSRATKNKYNLMLCELHFPSIHGKTEDSDPNIETHYLVYDIYVPITGIPFSYLDEYIEYDTDNEYDDDDDLSIEQRRLYTIKDDIKHLKDTYMNNIVSNLHYYGYHPTIRNYHNIISRSDYFKPEIGEYIILPTHEAIAILKTFWLRIIQKKWKKIFKERKNIIKQRCYLPNLSIREIQGKWPDSCVNLPGIRGMLSGLKN